MKSKIFAFSIFALFLIALVSATDFSVSPNTITFTPNQLSQTITITNLNESELLDVSLSNLIIRGEKEDLTFLINGQQTNINKSQPVALTITSQTNFIDLNNFFLGRTYSSVLNLTSENITKQVTVRVQSDYCEAGSKGDLTIRRIDLDNVNGYGEEDEWYLGDEVNVYIEVRNEKSRVSGEDNSFRNVIVEWAIYNIRTGEIIDDGEEKIRRLNERETQSVEFNIKLDPADFDESDRENDFRLIVKVYDDDSDDHCTSETKTITIPFDRDFVIASDLKYSDASCGQPLEITGRLWNIGEYSQDDISIRISNSELGISKEFLVGDLDKLESRRFTLTIDIPENAQEKTYLLQLYVLDEDGRIFENDDRRFSELLLPINISGNCQVPSSVEISAVLGSEAVAGKELIVITSLKNTGTKSTTYVITPTDYLAWAELKSIDATSITLGAGETKEIKITLVPNKNIEGDKEFKIQVVYNGQTEEQRVVVQSITPQENFFSRITGAVIGTGNMVIWGLIIAIAILILLIIIVAIRVSRRSTEE